jgi:uncharacterized protein
MGAQESSATYYLPEVLPPAGPAPDGRDKEFWEALTRHEIVVQCCQHCGNLQMEPEWLCYKCHSFELGWKQVAGHGRIYSWERVWYPIHSGLKDACPYLAVVVELIDASGLKLLGNLLGDPRQPVEIGAEVQAVFEDHEKGFTLLQWRLLQ